MLKVLTMYSQCIFYRKTPNVLFALKIVIISYVYFTWIHQKLKYLIIYINIINHVEWINPVFPHLKVYFNYFFLIQKIFTFHNFFRNLFWVGLGVASLLNLILLDYAADSCLCDISFVHMTLEIIRKKARVILLYFPSSRVPRRSS